MANKTTINGDTPRFCVINPDGSYAGIFCISYEEALMIQRWNDEWRPKFEEIVWGK